MQAVAKKLDCSVPFVYKVLVDNNVPRRKRGKLSLIQQKLDEAGEDAPSVEEALAKAYLGGARQVDLARQYNVSRQRIQQILKRLGISREHKPYLPSVETLLRLRAKAERTMATWGLTLEEFEEYNEKYGPYTVAYTPMGRYRQHRLNAETRKIGWNFTFKTWWAMWEASGKWEDRGQGGYGMGRIGDHTTPFGPDTCFIGVMADFLSGDLFRRRPTGNFGRK